MTTARRVFRQELDTGWIEVWDRGQRRSLWFDDAILQSEIDRRDAASLPNPANRAMLAHLLFGQRPRRVLLGGCGGGGIARWFHAQDPGIHGDAVEISPAVAQVARDWFDFPGPHSNWRLQLGDLRDLLSSAGTSYDFILCDLAERQQTPEWLTAPEFLAHCRRRLDRTGVLTLNCIADQRERFALALWQVRQAFSQRVLCLPVPSHDNVMLMAFAAPPDTADLTARAAQAQARWGLEFPRFLARLRRHNPPGSGVF